MSKSREDSPDWLRSFQAPTCSILSLSSDSDSSPIKNLKEDISDIQKGSTCEGPPLIERDENQSKIFSDVTAKSTPRKSPRTKTPRKRQRLAEGTPSQRRKANDQKKKAVKEDDDDDDEATESYKTKRVTYASKHSVLTLSSDSESDIVITGEGAKEEPSVPEYEETKVNSHADIVDPVKRSVPEADDTHVQMKKIKDDLDTKDELADMDVTEKTSEKLVEHRVTSSVLPLVFPEKVQRCKALVECEGDSIDLSGDVGAVGRVIITQTPSSDNDMLLDLKGTIYKTTIVPSRTFCVVSVGPSEAKIEAMMNNYIQLKPKSNVYDAETVVEGTLEGFSFDSGDEDDKISKAADQEGDAEEKQTDGKSRAKAVKTKAGGQKKAKATTLKQPKKKKPQPPTKRKK